MKEFLSGYYPGKAMVVVALLLLFSCSSTSGDGNTDKIMPQLGEPYWEELHPPSAPSPRTSFGYTYDVKRNTIVLFGGAYYEDGSTTLLRLNDTWEFDGHNWTRIYTKTTPNVRNLPALAYDKDREVVVMFGGGGTGSHNYYDDTWEYNGINWSLKSPQMKPDRRIGACMTFDRNLGEILMFGGENETNVFNDLWSYDGLHWQQIRSSSPSPSYRSMAGFAFDENRSVAVLHGGKSIMNCFYDTWEFDGAFWTQVASLPSNELCRFNFGFCYDDFLKKCVLFGGFYWGQPWYADTWEFDGDTWIETSPSLSPENRSYHSMIYSSALKKTVLFGGMSGDANSHDLDDTWVYSRQRIFHTPAVGYYVIALIIVLISFVLIKMRMRFPGQNTLLSDDTE